jgi:hypothetical protein
MGKKEKVIIVVKWFVALVLFVLALFFAGVGILDFQRGSAAGGFVGIVFFAILLFGALWIVGKPRKLRGFTAKFFVGGPYSHGQDLRTQYVVGGALFALFLFGFAYLGGAGVTIFAAIYFLAFPLASWFYLSSPIAKLVFAKLVKNERANQYIARMLRQDYTHPRFFFAQYTGKPNVWRRFSQTVIFSFALTAFLLPYLVFLSPSNQILAGGVFIIVGVVSVAIPSLMLVIVWVYEDSGLRYYDSSTATVNIPTAKAQGLLTGLVGIGAFFRLVYVIGGSSFEASAIAVALSFFLLTPTLLIVTIFHHKLEDQVVTKLRAYHLAENAEVRIVSGQE